MLGRITLWLRNPRNRRRLALAMLAVVLAVIAFAALRSFRLVRQIGDSRNQAFIQWGTGDERARQALVTARNAEACPGAPFILPADGFIGLLYGDPRPPYSEARPHQGIDIFSPTGPGITPVYAAYDGYISRDPGWVSSLIQRVPDDPLQPGRQIWLYYTHMANTSGQQDYIVEDFPPGTVEVFVEQGTLLGYAGTYSGNPARGIWVHLHFSIVRDDGGGRYTNELEFDNTIDPSRYLGIAVNYGCAPVAPACTPNPLCPGAVLGAGGG